MSDDDRNTNGKEQPSSLDVLVKLSEVWRNTGNGAMGFAAAVESLAKALFYLVKGTKLLPASPIIFALLVSLLRAFGPTCERNGSTAPVTEMASNHDQSYQMPKCEWDLGWADAEWDFGWSEGTWDLDESPVKPDLGWSDAS